MAAVAIGAAVITIVTLGTASTISGAMLTAAASSAASTAATSATNTALNADGDIWKQLKDITTTAIKDTTDEESLKNMAIAAGVAGLSAWAVQASGGSTSLESGGDAVYKPHPDLIEANPSNFANYNGVVDPAANNIGLANLTTESSLVGQPINYSTNPLFQNFWQGFFYEGGFISDSVNFIGGMNSMSIPHDFWGQNVVIGQAPILQITIVPAIAIQYCATSPGLCGVALSDPLHNNSSTE